MWKAVVLCQYRTTSVFALMDTFVYFLSYFIFGLLSALSFVDSSRIFCGSPCSFVPSNSAPTCPFSCSPLSLTQNHWLCLWSMRCTSCAELFGVGFTHALHRFNFFLILFFVKIASWFVCICGCGGFGSCYLLSHRC
eukprot:m.261113 g.261113  ORF g.261113 m.261113 type:complete len:137 (-) comp15575_c0_seq2:43-453(-)